jgi:2-C-methyl-D-erythritol 4-phosphate cytidylyltransferase
LLVHASEALLAARSRAGESVGQLVVTVPSGYVAAAGQVLAEVAARCDLWVVEGGATRQASVAAGLAALGPEVDLVLVHDAARAFAPAALVGQVIDAVRAQHPAVVPGLAVVDTVKRVGADVGGARPVLGTVPREELVTVQTPQGFGRALLERAHASGAARADDEAVAASDDAGLVEALGEPVWVIAGDVRAAKITTAADLARAELQQSAR